MPDRRRTTILIAVTGAIVTALLSIGAADGLPNWPVYLGVVLIGLAAVVWIDRRHPLSWFTKVGLAVFAVGHVAGGMVPVGDGVLYAAWIVEPVVRYDNVQHAIGFGVVGRTAWEVLRPRLGPAGDDPTLNWWIILLAACALGAFNEIIEWIMTLLIPGTDVGGYDNTARDLVANLVGGLVMATWTSRHPPERIAPPGRRHDTSMVTEPA
ncbi:MAG TPA: DUF2238 domain-containing protein [Nitriliruptoraceae bacterium]|nr:DUF2238 domain-containing protein [Nitriliruptoraceae bacterium]